MTKRMILLTYKKIGRSHTISSTDLPGFIVCSSSKESAYKSVADGIDEHAKLTLGEPVSYRIQPFTE